MTKVLTESKPGRTTVGPPILCFPSPSGEGFSPEEGKCFFQVSVLLKVFAPKQASIKGQPPSDKRADYRTNTLEKNNSKQMFRQNT